jgi:hypothetical protein
VRVLYGYVSQDADAGQGVKSLLAQR